MADTIRIKRRLAGGAAGAPSSLAAAELAYNEQDDTLYYGKGNSGGAATSIVPVAGSGSFASKALVAPEHGRLIAASTTQLKFTPYGGNQIKINGVLYTIPSSGIVSGLTSVYVNGAITNLVAGTTYLVSVFNTSGTLTFHFGTSLAHVTDTAAGNVGVEIVSGNSNYTVVGMVLINNSTQFEDSAIWRGVISWVNRRNKALTGNSTSGQGTASGTVTEILASARVFFLTWAEEHILMGIAGAVLSGGQGSATAQLGLDGAAAGMATFQTIANTTWWGPLSVFGAYVLSEGVHWITVMGAGNGVSMNFHMACQGLIRG